MKKAILLLSVAFALILSTGCNRNNQTKEITRIYIAHAIDESTENTGAANEWFRNELEKYLGIEVVQMTDVDHVIAIEAMRGGHLDIMFASAVATVRTQDVVDIEIVGRLNHSEVNPLTSLFITNNDEIQSIEDLEGRSFAFVSPSSSSGFFFPAFYLIQNLGLDGNLITHPGYFFSTTAFSGSHETTASGVGFGDFDAGAVLSTVFRGLVDSGVVNQADFRIIAETPPSPDSNYIMRADLPEDLKNKIRSFFLNLDSRQYFEDAWGFPDLRYLPGDYGVLDDIRFMQEVLGME